VESMGDLFSGYNLDVGWVLTLMRASRCQPQPFFRCLRHHGIESLRAIKAKAPRPKHSTFCLASAAKRKNAAKAAIGATAENVHFVRIV
jgi:hypothetical protein